MWIPFSNKYLIYRIKYESCWDVLDELKVDKSKVFVILTKFDSVIDPEQMKNYIANNLKISNPIAISFKSRYGIHKLKTMMASHINVVKSLNN